jgi:hypothetical protein
MALPIQNLIHNDRDLHVNAVPPDGIHTSQEARHCRQARNPDRRRAVAAVWKRLPHESTRVYRLQTDSGECIIGRKVSAAWVASAVEIGPSNLSPYAAFAALMDGKTVLDPAEGLQLRRVRVMGANRIELTGFTDAMRDRLSAYGLFHEIITWKLRMFVPTDAGGVGVLAKVLERYPIARVAERAA